MAAFPFTAFALLAGLFAILVCIVWAIPEFAVTHRKRVMGEGMSFLPALPALVPLLAPMMYVRSFGEVGAVWPSSADLVLGTLVIFASIPPAFAVGTLLPKVLVEKAASANDSGTRNKWIFGFALAVAAIFLLSFSPSAT